MKTSNKTIPLVEYIKVKEENKHNLKIDLETPTILEYLRNNNEEKHILKYLKQLMGGILCEGYADDQNKKICVFNKNYGLRLKIRDPFEYAGIPNLNDLLLSLTTLHEIRHILQRHKPELFTDYEYFCNIYLRIINNRYWVDTQFHDSQHMEIDADLYSAIESKELFRGNKKMVKFLDSMIADNLFRKCMFDYESYLKVFCKIIKHDIEEYQDDNYISAFWDNEGSFKTIKEIVNNKDFPSDSLLKIKILTSEVYLSTINYKDLSEKEISILSDYIDKNIEVINNNIEIIEKLKEENLITKLEYKEALKIIRGEIKNKIKYKEKINKKRATERKLTKKYRTVL